MSASRKGVIASSGYMNARARGIAEIVGVVAKELGKSASQVAIAWALNNPTVTAPIIGARTFEQARDNLGALSLSLSDDQLARLNDASAHVPRPLRFQTDGAAADRRWRPGTAPRMMRRITNEDGIFVNANERPCNAGLFSRSK